MRLAERTDPGGGISAARHQHVDGRVKVDGVDRAQVAVVMADHLWRWKQAREKRRAKKVRRKTLG